MGHASLLRLRAGVTLSLVLSVAAGCGDDPPAPPVPGSARKPATTAASARSSASASVASAAPSASAAPPASASPSSSAGPAESAGAPAGSASAAPATSGSGGPAAGPAPIGWGDFSGPTVKPTAKLGDPVWSVLPLSGSWEAVKIALLPVTFVDDRNLVVEQGGKRYLVPGAFASVATATDAASLAKGDPVLASAHGSRVYGRVVEIAGDKVKVRSKFAGVVEVADLSLREVVKLDGSPILGAPVVVKDGAVQRPGYLVHQSATRAWILQGGGRPRAFLPSEVTVLPAPKLLTVGQTVTGGRVDKMEAAVVTKVLDDGLQYEVKWEGGEDTATNTYEWLIPRDSAKKP